MERIPYNNRGRGSGGPRHDRSMSGPRTDGRHFNAGENYGRPMGGYSHPPPAPAPVPGHGAPGGYSDYPPPRHDMGGPARMPRNDYPPKPAMIDAAGAPTDTAKHAKRVYIGNIPNDTDPSNLETFLNLSLRQVNGCFEEGNPVLNSSFCNLEKRFMFAEIRSVEETCTLLQLDGISYRDHYLKIRRPVDYDKFPPIEPSKPIPRLDLTSVGIISTQVEDSPLKLFVGGLPHEMQEDQVKEMLNRFGKLKSFHLVKERNERNSKGYAFCEFINDHSTNACIRGLNNISLGHRTLNVKRSGSGIDPHKEESKEPLSNEPLVGAVNKYTDQGSIDYFKSMSPVVCLKNILSEDDLKDDALFNELYEDIKFELEKFGPVNSMIIPRHSDISTPGAPTSKNYSKNSLGQVYIEYKDISGAFGAYNLMNGKIFNNKALDIIFYDKDAFKNSSLD